ncbi:MAG: hypothetical protein HY281_07165 [Nitrospirae bacterium]|nr:hypothetical protein [Nitrospirota bacterium]
MKHMIWTLVAVFAAVALFEFNAARQAYRKLNALNEYVQFLLFQPKVYKDHQEKFLLFVSQNRKKDVSDQAMASYQAIEQMVHALQDEILLANVKSRSEGQSK